MASRVVRARLDEPSERALTALMRDGRTESEVVRAALVECDHRRAQRAVIEEQVRRVAADPEDTRERRALMDAMEELAPDWPE